MRRDDAACLQKIIRANETLGQEVSIVINKDTTKRTRRAVSLT